jgi:hypothetical protein
LATPQSVLRAAITGDDSAGLVRERHHRCSRSDDAAALDLRRRLAKRRPDADKQRPIADRHDHARGRIRRLLKDLLADRAIAGELGRLHTVLKERKSVRVGERRRCILRFV